MTRRRQGVRARLAAHRGLNGTLAVALIVMAVLISYSAQDGLPWQSTYDITVDIPDAAQLTKNSDVRIGGARIGQVLALQAMPARGGRRPFARLSLALDESVAPLAADTLVRMRLGSLLGGKYIELDPGHSRATVPDGGRLDLSHARSMVELDDALRLFDPPTAHALQTAIGGLGDGLAGRGASLNDATGAVSRLLPPLQHVLGVLADPRTRLARLVAAAAATTGTLAPVARPLADMLGQGARTMQAISAAGPALGQTLDRLPATELTGTVSLTHLEPVLAGAARLVRSLQPAAPLLVPATRSLDSLARLALGPVARIPAAVGPLQATMRAAAGFARDPATLGVLRVLGVNDLGSFNSSLLLGLGAILRTAAGAQLNCESLTLWMRNLSSAFSEGDSAGTWIRMLTVLDQAESMQQSAPSPDLHFNPYPHQNASECEAGNEPYLPGRQIGNPAGRQSSGGGGGG